ncbi:MAG: DUF6098 family protein [Candidatus Limnocylindrales bacterium]
MVQGPDHDGEEQSTDYATRLMLPGLAVSPLTPPTWWTLPVEKWMARQVRAHAPSCRRSARQPGLGGPPVTGGTRPLPYAVSCSGYRCCATERRHHD